MKPFLTTICNTQTQWPSNAASSSWLSYLTTGLNNTLQCHCDQAYLFIACPGCLSISSWQAYFLNCASSSWVNRFSKHIKSLIIVTGASSRLNSELVNYKPQAKCVSVWMCNCDLSIKLLMINLVTINYIQLISHPDNLPII